MKKQFNEFLDTISEFLAFRKGLLPFLGIVFVVFNLVITILFPATWLATTGLFLHFGIILSILGILIGWAL